MVSINLNHEVNNNTVKMNKCKFSPFLYCFFFPFTLFNVNKWKILSLSTLCQMKSTFHTVHKPEVATNFQGHRPCRLLNRGTDILS
jgi:hypothetical protein